MEGRSGVQDIRFGASMMPSADGHNKGCAVGALRLRSCALGGMRLFTMTGACFIVECGFQISK
jgi:hypothetical protein